MASWKACLLKCLSLFRNVFDHLDHVGIVSGRLLCQKEGTWSMTDYSVEFWTVAAAFWWNEEAFRDVFIKGEFVTHDLPPDLKPVANFAIWLDSQIRERCGE